MVILDEHIKTIFNDIITAGILDPESKYCSIAKDRCLKTCSHYYPLIEFMHNEKSEQDFLLHTSVLGAWTYFLDDALDYSMGVSQKIRANQIASFLLLRYYNWLKKYKSSTVLSLFNDYFLKYSQYLIIEKKWDYPQLYKKSYGNAQTIFNKALICFFPVDLLKLENGKNNHSTIKELFHYYFSFLLLADDLEDLEDDINSKCLTYPIIRYYDLVGKLPQSKSDIEIIIPKLLEQLDDFALKIDEMKNKNNWKLELICHDINNIFLSVKEKQIKP
ncbi:MAG: hypothetical protein M1480_17485 [Bacteroidetes bacterium]|nr:hypothetical protein [Bacteroidota bacterium]